MQIQISEKLQHTLNELERMTNPLIPANAGDQKTSPTVMMSGVHQNFKRPEDV